MLGILIGLEIETIKIYSVTSVSKGRKKLQSQTPKPTKDMIFVAGGIEPLNNNNKGVKGGILRLI